MSVTLVLIRHGRSTGQGPDSPLLPEGTRYVTELGRRLAREEFSASAAYSSPYRRARETARIVLDEIPADVPLELVHELTPDTDVEAALRALEAHGMKQGHVLVVSHMPLLGRLALRLTEDTVDFQPGTLAEIRLVNGAHRGTLVRRIGPDELDAG